MVKDRRRLMRGLVWLTGFLLLAGCSTRPSAQPPGQAAPQQPVRLVFAYPATPNLGYLPTLLAWQELRPQGYVVEPKFLSRAELAGQAVVTGDAQMAFVAPAVAVTAILEGADLVIVAAQQRNQWAMAAKKEVARPQDLAGKRIATHSETSITTTFIKWAAKKYGFENNYQMLIIPGSGPRMQALIANQIDASPLLLEDTVKLLQQQGDKFHIVINFAQELPALPDNVVVVKRSWAQQNRSTVEAVLAGIMRTYKKVNSDPNWAKSQAPAYFSGTSPDVIGAVVDAYVKSGIWDPTLVLDEKVAQETLNLLFDYGVVKGDRASAQVGKFFDFSYLTAARAAVK